MLLEVIGSLILGIVIIQNLGFSMMENLQRVVYREISQEEFISIGMFKFVGAILLIIPGVFTDIIGLLMQFDTFGSMVAKKTMPKKEVEDDIIDDLREMFDELSYLSDHTFDEELLEKLQKIFAYFVKLWLEKYLVIK